MSAAKSWFLVIGFYPAHAESRFAYRVRAENALAAETVCIEDHPGIAVVGVADGATRLYTTVPTVTHSHGG